MFPKSNDLFETQTRRNISLSLCSIQYRGLIPQFCYRSTRQTCLNFTRTSILPKLSSQKDMRIAVNVSYRAYSFALIAFVFIEMFPSKLMEPLAAPEQPLGPFALSEAGGPCAAHSRPVKVLGSTFHIDERTAPMRLLMGWSGCPLRRTYSRLLRCQL